MILQALEGVGGQQYLQDQARENPGVFLALVGKVLPLQVQADVKSELTVRIPIHEHRPAAALPEVVEVATLSPVRASGSTFAFPVTEANEEGEGSAK